MTEISWVTCHQPSPEGLKVPWLEPALLASSATNRVNSGDRFPPGGKQWGAASLSPPVPRGSLRRTACSYDPLVTRRNNIYTHTYIYIYPHHILYIIYIRLVFPLQKGRTRVRYEVSFSAFVIPKLVLGPPFCSKDTLGIL